MSSVEKEVVKEAHRLKAHEAELMLNESSVDQISKDLYMHLQMNNGIKVLQDNLDRKKNKKRNVVVRSLSFASKQMNKGQDIKDYYFDYNTVEQVLIACSIFLSLIAIMFESGQFYRINPVSGLEELNPDPSAQSFYTAVLIFGAIVLIGSLVYYMVVFIAEVVGHVPGFVRSLFAVFADKKTRAMKLKENEGDDLDDEGFEMVQNNMYANPMADLEKAKDEAARRQHRIDQMEEERKGTKKQAVDMMEQMKRLKQENQRNLVSIKKAKNQGRTPRKRKEMAQQRVQSSDDN